MNDSESTRCQKNPAGASSADLFWTAFCYVRQELTADEVIAFEDRLGVDEQAREEVARVVELSAIMAAASQPALDLARQPAQPVTVASRQRRWLESAAWMLLGAAACLLVTVSLESRPSWENATTLNQTATAPRVVQNEKRDLGSAALALAWSHAVAPEDAAPEFARSQFETADELGPNAPYNRGLSDNDNDNDAYLAGLDAPTLPDSAGDTTPLWMFAAVSHRRNDAQLPLGPTTNLRSGNLPGNPTTGNLNGDDPVVEDN